MHHNTSVSRALRACVLGLATVTAAVVFTADTADARRHRHHRHHARHHVSAPSYNPAFASIIVDGNSGAILSANNPDSLRHPASLTKIMTLYMLFERLEAGKLSLDSQMEVSEHASIQAPTKLGLRPGQTLRVEDAIKALVTRSANDAAVVIAEAIAGDEDTFARMMTKKARALGMSRTVYRNASGLPNDDQVTTARDQATLGRAIQDRFPRYYRYFATSVFVYKGHPIRNHNRLLGVVEGVDGIKTGYTRASGFNLVSSMRRGNRHLIGVVLGGRSGGSRDAIMRNLLAENLDKASGQRTVAAITERDVRDQDDVAEERSVARPAPATRVADADPEPVVRPQPVTRAAAPAPAAQKPEAGPLNNGVIQNQQLAAIPGSNEPMKPVRVKTVQVKAGTVKLASAVPGHPAPAVTNTIPARNEVAETSAAVIAKSDRGDSAEIPQQPAAHGTGQGILGVLPASSTMNGGRSSMAYADPARVQPSSPVVAPASTKPAIHAGWIVQVGALESETEAKSRLNAARERSKGLLAKAESFTETVAKGDKKLYRARFAVLDRDQAEAACRTLKRSDISCIAIKN